MPPPQGLAYFPGITQIVDGEISFGVGATPSKAMLTIAPQLDFTAQIGTLVFFDGRTRIEWPDARIDTNSFDRTSEGLIWRLVIHDRRWRWQSTGGGGAITLGANLRTDDGELIKDTELPLQEIAKECFDRMLESNYDVSVLPDAERPEILWDGALPAQCLEELVGQFGCNVVLGLDNLVRICKVGDGAQLPDTPDILTNSLSLTLQGMPPKIVAVCALDRFQVDLKLEAVGIENDGKGTLLPIDQLSYKPTGGWDTTAFEFNNITNKKSRALARKSVYRYYRVVFPIRVPGYVDYYGNPGTWINFPWQVRLETTQVEYLVENPNPPLEYRRNKPAAIGGIFCLEGDGNLKNNMDQDDLTPYQNPDPLKGPGLNDVAEMDVTHTWHLGEEGSLGKVQDHLVIFDNPIYMNTAWNDTPPSTTVGPAVLILRTACTLLDSWRFAPVRTFFTYETGSGVNTLSRYELFSDLEVWHYWSYTESRLIDNVSTVRKDAEYYINGIKQEYQAAVPQTISYVGLKRIELDGAIQHVHYRVGKTGCTTSASRNSEQLHRIQSLAYRKLMNRIKSGLRETKKRQGTLRRHRRGGG
jgi:hypothetical protein